MKLASRPLAIGGVAVATLAAALVVVLLLTAGPAKAKEFATLHVLAGRVEVERGGAGPFKQALDGQTLRAGDVVKTGPDGRAQITYFDGSITRVDFNTTYRIVELTTVNNKAKSKIIRSRQDRGRTFNRVVKLTDSGSRVETQTPTATASVRGTVYVLGVAPDGGTLLEVLKGTVGMQTGEGLILVHEGEKIVFHPDGSHGPVQKLTEQDLQDPWLTFNQCVVDQESSADCPGNQPEGGTSTTPTESQSGTQNNNNNPPPPPPLPPAGNQAPLASFAASTVSGPPPLAVHFTDFSSDPDGDPLTLLWQFGDGGTSTSGPSVDHTYTQPGDLQASLTVTDPSGASDSIATTIHVVSDQTPPDSRITDGPPDATNSTTARFAFDATEASSTFECSFDGSGFSSCDSPFERSGLSDGHHTFEVRATDTDGNTDPTPAARSFTVDTEAPAHPEIVSGPDDPTNSQTARFEFRSGGEGAPAHAAFGKVVLTASAGGVRPQAKAAGIGTAFGMRFLAASGSAESFQCSLDGSEFSTCHSPEVLTVGSGDHGFRVRAADEAGNHSSPATFSWRTDLHAPEITVTDRPDNPTNLTSALIAFTVDDPAAGVTCDLGGNPLSPCESPLDFSELSDGLHNLHIHATDAAGNTGSETVSWRVDTHAPDVSITSGPDDPSDVDTATFEFTSHEDGATFRCRLDEDPYKKCQSGLAFTGLSEGNHTFQVKAKDQAGNTGEPDSFSWKIHFPEAGGPVVITLTWNSGPADMDLHVQTPDFNSDDGGEVWSGNPCHPSGGSPPCPSGDWAALDKDGNASAGRSETITVDPQKDGFLDGTNHIWVENFSCDDGSFDGSGATVTVTQSGSPLGTFRVADLAASEDQSLDTWLVGRATISPAGEASASGTQSMDGDQCGASIEVARPAIVGRPRSVQPETGGGPETTPPTGGGPGPDPSPSSGGTGDGNGGGPSPEPSPTETTPTPEPSPTETTPSPDPSPSATTSDPPPSPSDAASAAAADAASSPGSST